MAEMIEESQGLESTTVGIYRTAAVVKGGRRFSFSAMVVVGDRHGSVGLGYGKAPGVPAAIEKAQKDAKKKITRVTLQGGTIPHAVTGRFGASSVKLVPAAPGTGVIAGGTVRAVLEMVGIRDCLTKAYGSTNQKNLCKAALEGLLSLRTRERVAELRGVSIDSTRVEEILALGERYMPKASGEPRAKGPVNVVGQRTSGGRGGRGGPRGGRGRRGEESPASAPPSAPPVEPPSVATTGSAGATGSPPAQNQ
jgi:small subunit ribosomal protein S5